MEDLARTSQVPVIFPTGHFSRYTQSRDIKLTVREMSTSTAAQLVENIKQLVALPDACIRVNELIDDPQSSAGDFAEVEAEGFVGVGF